MKILAWTLAGGTAIYLAAANYALNSQLLRSTINTWEDGEVEYAWGFSPFPGVVYLRGFYIAHEDRNVRWNLHLGRVRTTLGLADLIQHRLRAYNITAEDGRFVLLEKKRLAEKDATNFLPPAASPNKKTRKPEVQPSEGPPRKWGIHLTQVRVNNLTEAWVNGYRILGALDIQGSVEVVANQSVQVGPASVTFHSGNVLYGTRSIGTGLSGKLKYKMDAFHPDADDPQVYRSMSSEGELTVTAAHLEPLNLFFRRAPWLGLSDVDAKIDLKYHLKNGVLQKGTHVSLPATPMTLNLGPYAVHGLAGLDLSIPDPGSPHLVLKSSIQNLSLSARDRSRPLEGGHLVLTGSTTGLSLAGELFAPLKLHLSLKGPVPSLARLNHLLPEDSAFRFESGTALVQAEFFVDSTTPGRDHGAIALSAQNAVIDVRGLHLAGRMTGSLPLVRSSVGLGIFRIHEGEISLFGTERPWIGRASFVDMVAQTSGQLKISGLVAVEASDSKPFIEYAKRRGLSSLVASLLEVQNIRTRGRFELRPKDVMVKDIFFDSSGISVRGDYSGFGALKKGHFLVVKEPFALGVDVVPGQDTRIILNDAFKWYGSRSE